MKFLRYISVFALSALVLSGCETDLKEAYIADESEREAPVMASYTGEPISIDADNMDEKISLSWSKANYGFPAGTEYTLSLEYGDATSGVKTVFDTSAELSYEDINKAALAIGATPNQSNELNAYVTAKLGSQPDLVSNKIELTVTPFKVEAFLYVVGSHQGWKPSEGAVLYAKTNDVMGDYEGFFYFTVDPSYSGFIFLDKNTDDWAGKKYGAVTDGDSPAAGLTDDNAQNMNLTAEGLYRVRPNLTAMTCGVLEVTTVDILGDITAGGNWSTTLDFTQDATDKLLWTASDAALTAGEFKVRFNGGWNDFLSWGELAEKPYLSEGAGGNIKLASGGTYDVTVDLSVWPYDVTFTAQ